MKGHKKHPRHLADTSNIEIKTEIAIARYENTAPFPRKRHRKPRRPPVAHSF